jgi:chromosome segregation ATPase
MHDQTFDLLKASLDRIQSGQDEIRASMRHVEKMLEKHEAKLDNHSIQLASHQQRHEGTDKRLDELKAAINTEVESKLKETKAEIEKKLEPMHGLFKNVSGFWTVLKWGSGIAAALAASFYTYLRIMVYMANTGTGTP